MPVTDNNMIGQVDAPNAVRYQIAPVFVDLAGHSREEVMDQNPRTCRLMAKELKREGKLRAIGTVDGEKIGDPRNYLYFELQLGRSESSVATLVPEKADSDSGSFPWRTLPSVPCSHSCEHYEEKTQAFTRV
jgi:hypothetical protein